MSNINSSSGNEIVEVSSIVPGVTATSLGKAEDTVHATGDTGVFSLGIGNEAQTTLAADGDYIGHSTDVKGNALTVGNLAHDAVDAGFPLKTGTLTLGLNLTQTVTGTVTGIIPVSYYARLRTTGTGSMTYRAGQETVV